jgi:hypothetical protein
MTVDKAFRMSTVGSFGRGVAYKEGKSISKVSVYSGKNDILPLSQWVQSNIIDLMPGS